MKTLANVLLVGAVAVMAIAISAAPSEAAKKKKAKAAPAACTPGMHCTAASGVVQVCGGDRKLVAILHPACVGPGCPPKC
jgi:hypothetical protein